MFGRIYLILSIGVFSFQIFLALASLIIGLSNSIFNTYSSICSQTRSPELVTVNEKVIVQPFFFLGACSD